MDLKLTKPVAFIDIEATGMHLPVDKIIEISIIKIMPDGNQHSKTYRVNPGIPIPQEVIEIHGITNEDIKDEPYFKDIADKLFIFLEDCDFQSQTDQAIGWIQF